MKRVLYLTRIWDVAVDRLAVFELLLMMDPTLYCVARVASALSCQLVLVHEY